MSSLPRGVVTTGIQRWKHKLSSSQALKLSSSQAAAAKFSAKRAESKLPMVAVETTVGSIGLPTSSSPKQRIVSNLGGRHADSQVRCHGDESELQRRGDSSATIVRKVETTNANDYEALVVRLLSQMLDGQADAVTDLVNLSFPRLLVLCRARLGKWLLDFDEDVALDVLFNFIRQYQAGVFPEVQDSSGLWGILRYKVHKRVQRIARQCVTRATRIPIARAVADEQDVLTNYGSPDSSLQRVENIEVLEKFLQWLPQNDREMFLMALGGQSISQIAKEFSLTSRTIRNRRARILTSWQHACKVQRHSAVSCELGVD